MQVFRRTIQVIVLLLIIVIPIINLYGIKIRQRDEAAIEKSRALSFVHVLLKDKDRKDVIALSHTVKGSVWAMDIAGFKITDPLALLESTTIALFLYLPLLLSVVGPVLFTIILGRVYCGWLCPMNLVLEVNDKLRTLLEKIGYNTRDVKFGRNTKYAVLIVGLIAAYFAGMPLLSLIYPPAVMSREIFYKVYNGIWGNGIIILGLICFFELILSRRWWCRHICPGGTVYIVLSTFRRLKIQRNDHLCNQCGDCVPVCPYDLKPMTRELTRECDQCGQCIAACKPDALKYTFKIKISGS
ncbi:MAG: 4Fe-4S binding protein [bacterium]|nr:4Fe-4S binding protein [bacterium]